HEHGAGDGAAERRGVEVGPPGRADMERTASQGGESLLARLAPTVDPAGPRGAVLDRPLRYPGDVEFVVLPDVGGVGAGHRALGPHPGDRHRGVQATGEGDADALTDRERGQ